MTRKHHSWAEEDVTALDNAVEECTPLLDHYRGQATKGGWWDAVAGALFQKRGITVTGKACQRKWSEGINKNTPADTPQMSDGWAQVAARVEEYERDLSEATYDVAEETRKAVLTICRELGVGTGNDQMDKAEATIDELCGLLQIMEAKQELSPADKGTLEAALKRAARSKSSED
jgi:hypothetical protein